MIEASPMSVIGAGMVTSTGNSWPTTCAAIRARISGTRRDNLWDHEAGDNLVVGRPYRQQWWEGVDLLADLAVASLEEALDQLPSGADPLQTPVILLLSPPTRACREADYTPALRQEFEQRLGRPLPAGSLILEKGSTGLLDAISQANMLMSRHQVDVVAIVAVESFLRQVIADHYMEERRLLTADNSNGFVPGEAACTVLVAKPGRSGKDELTIIGWGTGTESGTIQNDAPLTGFGLTAALRNALKVAGIEWKDTDYWLNDQNGEAYKFKESTVAQIRLERRAVPAAIPFLPWHPIEFIGEIGTAIGPHLLGLALYAHRKAFAPGPRALLHVTEDNGDRAALVLEYIKRR